jgi:adenylosuccinate lyase
MTSIWEPETRFRIWFEIEAHAATASAELGIIPKAAAKKIWEKGSAATFDIDRIDAIEAVTKHDVIAFLTHLAEHVGPEARFVHQGMTSSDVLDTCLKDQLVRAAELLIADRPARPPCHVFCNARRHRLQHRALSDRDPAFAADGGS